MDHAGLGDGTGQSGLDCIRSGKSNRLDYLLLGELGLSHGSFLCSGSPEPSVPFLESPWTSFWGEGHDEVMRCKRSWQWLQYRARFKLGSEQCGH